MFPKANITWIDLNSTNQIRDALIAGDINAGSCSPLPYFLGWTAGVDWKLLVKMTEFDAILFAQPNGPSTLDELAKATGKIGAGPGTAYDFAIQMALKKEGADQKAFQKRLVQLSVGDAMAAFSTGELAAHFAPADAAILHTEHGSKPVLRLNDVFDAPHFVGVCTTDTAYKTSPQLLGGLREAIKAVVNWMNANRVASDHEILATNDKLTSNVLDAVFSDGLVKWSTTNPRIEVFAAAMSAMGYEKRKANSASEFYIYPEDQANAQ
jgi:ABC-type nitrate/sulfonate/bicarbonate transport system substrate-binding protein